MNIRKGLAAGVLALGLAVVAPLAGQANATDSIVVGPDTFKSELKAGVSLELKAGYYGGTYRIPEGVHITAAKGVDSKDVRIDSFEVFSKGVQISNVTFDADKGRNAAIRLSYSISGLRVENVTFKDKYEVGIWAQPQLPSDPGVTDANGVRIMSNVFEGVSYGGDTDTDVHIEALSSSSVEIMKNHFKGRVEVWSHGTQTRLSGVKIESNYWTPTDKYAGPTKNLLKIRRIDAANIQDNHINGIKGVTAITVQSSSRVKLISNQIDGVLVGIGIIGGNKDIEGDVSDDIQMDGNKIAHVNTGINVSLDKYQNSEIIMLGRNGGNTIENADYGVDVAAGTMKDGYKFVVECGNHFLNIRENRLSRPSLVDDHELAGKCSSNETPEESGKGGTTTVNTDGDNANNANGAKAPNTGAVSVIETLAAITGLSAVAIAGAIYARKRAYNANK